MRIAHLTSVHQRYDTRVFAKQCKSLAALGHDVTLVVADGNGDEVREGVRIVDTGKEASRLGRMINSTRRILRTAFDLDADAYHIHDPELLPSALKLKRSGKRVVFDSHEDVPADILDKAYLHPVARRVISTAFRRYETYACSKLDCIVGATPFITEKFVGVNRTVNINNYPVLGELESPTATWEQKQARVCYVGDITRIRGIQNVVEAVVRTRTRVRLSLGGRFSDKSLRDELIASAGWNQVDELGYLNRNDVRVVLAQSMAGVVMFLPAANHITAQPNKMFEYMAAGIPVIASNFPLWRDIIEGSRCGICVDPADSGAIAQAIDTIVADPDASRQMGANGRHAIEHQFNWGQELHKLERLYST